jgi:MinD-like ATPase involved in chromosome partitioning or flagellar assembly
MPLIAFCGYYHGQVRTTGSAIAVSTIMAANYKASILLWNTNLEKSMIEEAFAKNKRTNSVALKGNLESLANEASSGALTRDVVRSFTSPILENKLDLLIGAEKDSEKKLIRALPPIIDAIKNEYDVSIVDVSSGFNNELTRIVLDRADIIVVCLNQNKHLLSDYFDKQDSFDQLKNKKIIYCLGAYDPAITPLVSKIKLQYKISNHVGVVPYSSSFATAINNKDTISYTDRIMSHEKKLFSNQHAEEIYFRDSVIDLCKHLLKGTEIQRTSKEGSDDE